jgi:hypothetical protein
MNKSWNQLYKESGTTLSYKEWRRREDDKMASFDGIKAPSITDSPSYIKFKGDVEKATNYKSDLSKGKTFGIPNYLFYISGLVVIGAIAYKIYKNKNK